MGTIRGIAIVLIAFAFTGFLACSNEQKAREVATDIRHALHQAGLNNVRVRQDRDKAVVILTGNVAHIDDRARAESIARSIAGNQVVSDDITILTGDVNSERQRNSGQKLAEQVPNAKQAVNELQVKGSKATSNE